MYVITVQSKEVRFFKGERPSFFMLNSSACNKIPPLTAAETYADGNVHLSECNDVLRGD